MKAKEFYKDAGKGFGYAFLPENFGGHSYYSMNENAKSHGRPVTGLVHGYMFGKICSGLLLPYSIGKTMFDICASGFKCAGENKLINADTETAHGRWSGKDGEPDMWIDNAMTATGELVRENVIPVGLAAAGNIAAIKLAMMYL